VRYTPFVLRRSIASGSLLVAIFVAAGCAQVLGYDDYRAREERDAAPVDTGAVVDSAIADVADAGEQPFRTPTRPPGDPVASGSGKTLWLAFKTYRLGSVDPAGVSDETAWMVHGYDLDNICTSHADSVANLRTCRRPEGALQDSLMDGERCRDNNFGRYVGTIIRSAAADTEKTLNEQIAAGAATWILRIDDVDEGADDPYAPAMLYRAADERTSTVKMLWDGTDVRSVHSDTVIGGDISRGVTTLPRGYIKNGTWVSGEPALLDLRIPVTATLFVPMKLDSAQMTVDLGTKTGVLAGVLAVPDVEAVLMPIADNGGVCPGTPLYNSMLVTIAKMPDVSLGIPSLQDTTSTCNGVSAGMGFEVVPVQPVTNVVNPPPPKAPRCADAG